MLPELRLIDYLTKSIVELVEHPDFSTEALRNAMKLSQMKSRELEDIHNTLGGINNG